MPKVIIVGSGVAATAAALEFADQGIKPLMIDVGLQPGDDEVVEKNFYDYAQENDTFDLLIGKSYDGLYNVVNADKAVPAKLAAPQFRFVTRDAEKISPRMEERFSSIQSFAKGGLANAWGAGLYEYNDDDLAGFPIKHAELAPFYSKLAREIGISGTDDDLTPFWGDVSYLHPPLKLSKNAQILVDHYRRKRSRLNRQGFFLGRPRLGVLTQEHNGRPACAYDNLEFWSTRLLSIYSPRFTLDRLIKEGKLDYKSGYVVQSWQHDDNEIKVQAITLTDNSPVAFTCDKLVVAAGAINSAKIALASRHDTTTRLGLMDNGAYQIPFFLMPRIGAELERDAFGLTQLNVVYESAELNQRLQASILEITGPARAEFFSYFPLAARSSIKLIKYFLPSMMVMQLFLPEFKSCADLSLAENGLLVIKGREKRTDRKLLRRIVRFLGKLGGVTHPALIVDVKYGHSIHYAGTLPMSDNPQSDYQCDRSGRLHGETGVYVVDGALFPALPAKNYSLTVMANAMRICAGIAQEIKSKS